jgi:hypothetical protein
MSDITFDISDEAFALACQNHAAGALLSAEEMAAAPAKIREYIDALVSSGERDPEKIARTAVCLVREYEQISRSVARVAPCVGIVP